MIGRAPEVDQGEIELPGVFVDAGATPDDLLELGHGAYCAVQNDKSAGLGVHTGGEQARGGDEDGIPGLRVDEATDLGTALGVIPGDPPDVTVILLNEVRVLIDEGLAHPGGVFGVHAENDGLLKPVAALLEEVGDLFRHELRAVVDDEGAVEVLLIVETVLDLVTLTVHGAFLRAVAFDIPVDVDLHHLSRARGSRRRCPA